MNCFRKRRHNEISEWLEGVLGRQLDWSWALYY